MAWLIVCAIIVVILLFLRPRRKAVNLAPLPQRFIVLDLETTGLDPVRHEIIEIGAIRVYRDSDIHDTFRTLVKPVKHIPKTITEINGISQDMVDREGVPLEEAIRGFATFIGDLPLVTFNAEFDMAFLQTAAKQHNLVIGNQASCALRMARLAWPGRKSYRLSDLARDGGLSDEGTHHALDDCRRTLIVYVAAVSILGVTDAPIAGRGPELRPDTWSPGKRTYRQDLRVPTDPVERNLRGMEFEAEGLTDNAIECYEANVRDSFEGNHPYDRLAVIFRRRGDTASEIAVLTRAIELFSQLQTSSRSDVAPKLEKFRQRLRRVSARAKDSN
jgi:DNA polymerase-3 subunit epsilon